MQCINALMQKNSHDKRNKYSSIINIVNQDLQLDSIKMTIY